MDPKDTSEREKPAEDVGELREEDVTLMDSLDDRVDAAGELSE